MLLDWRLERKWSAVGYCTGAICGLVAIVSDISFTLLKQPFLICYAFDRLLQLDSSVTVPQFSLESWPLPSRTL